MPTIVKKILIPKWRASVKIRPIVSSGTLVTNCFIQIIQKHIKIVTCHVVHSSTIYDFWFLFST